MPLFEIKSRWSGKVLFSLEATSLRLCVEAAVKRDADLRGADLRGANLRGADLWDADLRGANLGDADLTDANLWDANLRDANLWDADLRGANLTDANLRDANLWGADLTGANLTDANLRDANLRGADLTGADLSVEIPPLNSHQFISEVLWREAKTEPQKDFAARVRMEVETCWENWPKLARKKKVVKWAVEVLGKWDVYKEKIEEILKERG